MWQIQRPISFRRAASRPVIQHRRPETKLWPAPQRERALTACTPSSPSEPEPIPNIEEGSSCSDAIVNNSINPSPSPSEIFLEPVFKQLALQLSSAHQYACQTAEQWPLWSRRLLVAGSIMSVVLLFTATTTNATVAVQDPTTLSQSTSIATNLKQMAIDNIGGLAEAIRQAHRLFMEQLAFSFHKLSYADVLTRAFFCQMVALPFCLIMGWFYSKESRTNLKSAVYKIYCILYRFPSYLVTEPTPKAYVIVNIAFFVGLLVFAVLLSFISDEVKTALKSIRSGRFQLHLAEHTLVLNWNNHTVPLLRQIALARAEQGVGAMWQHGVVVLADRDKAEMDIDIAQGLRGYPQLELYTRSGSPFRQSDLNKVAAQKAAAVIVLHPNSIADPDSAAAYKAATLMSLAALRPRDDQKLVVQEPNNLPPDGSPVSSYVRMAGASSARSVQLLNLHDEKIIMRVIAQTTMQPGVATVLSTITQQDVAGVQVHFVALPAALEGRTFLEARRSFADCVLLGCMSGTDLVMMADDATVLQPDDRLLLLCTRAPTVDHQSSRGTSALYEAAAKRAFDRLRTCTRVRSQPRHVIIAGWNAEEVDFLVDSMSQFAPEGTTVTIITQNKLSDLRQGQVGNCRFHVLHHEHPTSSRALQAAGIRNAHTVVVGGLDGLTDSEADCRVLASLLQVHDAAVSSGRVDCPHVVAKARRPNTVKVAARYLATWKDKEGWAAPTMEVLLPDELISAIITQVAAEKDYQVVISELLDTAQGVEVYIHPPSIYNIHPGEPVMFAEVAEAARMRDQIALGYIRADNTVVLAPAAGDMHVFAEGDRVVVLSEDYNMDKPILKKLPV